MTVDTTLLHAPYALVGDRWQRDVRIAVDARGTIVAMQADASPLGCERLAGPVLPGMPNAHSHAFQRALAGRTGKRMGEDSFWTWRTAMYDFVARLDPEAFEAIATQAYAEMVCAGYTAVAEFHYVHRDAAGQPYADPAELSLRLVAAAAHAGIALTLLPVFYGYSGFGGAPVNVMQRRFVQSPQQFADLLQQLAHTCTRDDVVLGVAPHSLRAITPDTLQAILAHGPGNAPIHIHAAEQQQEVDACIAWSGQRPVEWLVAHAGVDARWCIVHGTHTNTAELDDLAARGTTVVLAPTTEADLGDGTFGAEYFVAGGGIVAIGSDSNTIIDPFAELRQLEYSQRLALQRRNVLARADAPVGHALWTAAAAGGAKACGRATGTLAVGMRADLVVLNVDDPALVDLDAEGMLESATFGPCRAPVRDTVVAGRFVVRQGVHVHGDAILRDYRATLARILA